MKEPLMLSYHSNPVLKAQFVRLLGWHQEADKIVQGSYQDDETAAYAAYARKEANIKMCHIVRERISFEMLDL